MNSLANLVDAFRCLPGIGPKSAQRLAFYLLKNQRQRGLNLAKCLEAAMQNIQQCKTCNNYTDLEQCSLCTDSYRDSGTLCIVESPADVIAIEQTSVYKGKYFVLMGKISPLDGIGPDDIGLDKLTVLIECSAIKEVILALSPTIEGITTIYLIQEQLSHYPIHVTQLAHGIPSGGELEFLDGTTISHALRNRATLNI